MSELHRYYVLLRSGVHYEVFSVAYPVLKETPCGAWIELGYGFKPRFVNLTARKQFACRTKAEALESFRARKRRQIKILKAKLEDAECCLAAAHEVTA